MIKRKDGQVQGKQILEFKLGEETADRPLCSAMTDRRFWTEQTFLRPN